MIVNGIGYDPWAHEAARRQPGRAAASCSNVGDLVGVKAGGNPHRWYSPGDVQQVIDAITADYKRLDPADAAYFDAQKAALRDAAGSAEYKRLIATIKAQVRAASRSARPRASSRRSPQALGLKLLTPAVAS